MRHVAVALNGAGIVADNISTSEEFFIYEIENSQIAMKDHANCYGVDLVDKIDFLKDRKISTLFIKDVSDLEIDAFGNYAIEIYVNCEGSSDELIGRYLSGELDQNYTSLDEPIVPVEELARDAVDSAKGLVIPPLPPMPGVNNNLFPMTGFEIAHDQLDQSGHEQFGFESEYEYGQSNLESEIKDRKNKD